MGDLMNDTCQFLELANQYGNFRVPAAKILVDGSAALPLGDAGLSELVVTLSVGPAGSAAIKIAGAYDRKARTFQSDVKDKFSLGKTLEVELGYLSDTTMVFKGFIASVVMEFTEDPTLCVTAMDARRLMMQADRHEKHYSDKNYSDIVSAIMSPYSSLCTLEQESTSDDLEKAIYQKTSDYDFIKNVLAKKLNKEFFILADKAYFREPKKVSAEIMTLEYGLNLLSFRRQSDYLHCKVIAGGYDKEEQKAIYSDAEAKNTDEQEEVLSAVPEYMIVQEDATGEGELKSRAAQVAMEKADKAQTGYGTCIGMPEIVPGRFIKLNKLDSGANQKYYIVQVKHSFGENGFYTEFETEGFA